MKKLVFYAHSMEIGGIEKSLLALLKKIDYKLYSVDLILEKKEGELLNNLPKDVNIIEYKISSDKNIIIRKIKNRLKLIFNIIKNYHRYDFSCAFIPYSIPGSILMRFYSKNNAYFIHTDYYYLFNKDVEMVRKFYKKYKIEKFKHILMVSNEAKENLLKSHLLNNITVVSNIIEYDYIKESAKEKINEKSKYPFTFINVSRHDEHSKKISKLIEAVKILVSIDNKFELWLVGDGKDTNNYKVLVKKYGLNKNIKFLGSKINPYPYYKKGNAFVLTSNYEGFPVVYLESLIFGLSIVTTIPISNAIIDIKDYSVIVNKDAQSIADGMLKVMQQKYKQKKLDIEKYNEKSFDIFMGVIDGKKHN